MKKTPAPGFFTDPHSAEEIDRLREEVATLRAQLLGVNKTEEVSARKKIEASEAEISRERDKLNLIFRESPAAMAVWRGEDLIFELVNPGYQALFEGRELVGLPLLEALPELADQPYLNLIRQVFFTGTPHTERAALARTRRTPDGPIENRYYDFSFVRIHNSQGRPYGVYNLAVDVTERVLARKIIEQNEGRVQRYAEAMPQMAFMTDADGEVTYFNSQHYDYTGVDRIEKEGSRWKTQNIVHPDDLQISIDAWSESVRTGKTYEIEYRLRRKDGVYRWHLARGIPDRDLEGNIRAWYGTNTDIHEQKEAQKRLEDERELRERFVAALTHDLRTPLTAAKMSAQMLERGISDPAKLQKTAGRIADHMDRADEMIRDLLDAGRIKSGEKIALNLSECNLNALTGEVIEDLSIVHGNRFTVRAASSPIRGYWDYSAIRRVLENLLGNAIKYGFSSAPVTIELGQGADADAVQISVHNEGDPIPESLHADLFEPYRRSDLAQSGSQKGWGIGLTLVRGFVDAHQGRIYVKSRAGEGTTFFVELPRVSGKR